MNTRATKYLAVFTGPSACLVSLSLNGWWTLLFPVYVFILLPLAELFLPPDEKNMEEMEEEMLKTDRFYDYLLYVMVPVQFALVILFLFVINQPGLSGYEIFGKVFSLGISCAILGINVGHELGHRTTPHEKFMSKCLLLTSLYMHFFIEHNRGHHKNVSTDDDPASAKYGEALYPFWFRTVVFSFISAWKIEHKRLQKEGHNILSIHNEMLWYQVIQFGFVFAIFYFFGLTTMIYFILAAITGFLLLETVNYIEHYGLRRRKSENSDGYEKVLPVHSWNSDHALGRIMLFELSRHSDHHYKASRKYQLLRHFDDSPQMPTGYPGMVLLAFFPPLWFFVMHKHIRKFREENPGVVALA